MIENVLQLIGKTPLVKINSLNENPDVTLAIKLEGYNPGGSIKDRAAYYMIKGAEERGELTKDKIIIEPTSGNTGIGLAMVATFKGYRIKVTMAENMSIERRRILEAFGAEVILTPACQGTDGAIEKALEIFAENPGVYYMPNQFNNLDNALAHYETTAPEIWRQTDGKITHFVAGMGTTGTLMGVSKKLKELNPDIKIIAAEPYPDHKIQGLKNMQEAIVPKLLDRDCIDRIIKVEDDDAISITNLLARNEGIFTGMSTGAALHVGIELAKSLKSGYIVVISPDRGEKYVSSDLFCEKHCQKRKRACDLLFELE